MTEAITPTSAAASLSFEVRPIDYRCRYWCKIIRNGENIPTPSNVSGAKTIPYPYVRNGDEELFPGDILLEGEENHHRNDRGWTYWIRYVNSQCELITYRSSFTKQKEAAKKLGLPPALLAGSGDLAGAVRVAHALRMGFILPGHLD